ncbi:mono-ADP-ribosyltransferase PARP10 isoform X1 [Pelobates cultripes]|uniref:Poly [ADP-ribose] polymerase n=1 Tax=Pelobates cultripes TaxID=61616 RepID=A0AAD1S3B1_PELCU|nr:mono-ADP-ribosyltransferase PARP10 isoform X1 [Pelobates cultripes]
MVWFHFPPPPLSVLFLVQTLCSVIELHSHHYQPGSQPAIMAEVEVSGLTESLVTDYLILYFESRRRSGGGPVKIYTRNGCEAFLTFSDPADAQSVLSRPEHIIQDIKVQVQRPPPWDPGKIALRGLNPHTDIGMVKLYIENMSDREILNTVLSADRTAALVTFQDSLSDTDVELLIDRVKARELQGASLSVQRVRASNEVLVQNVESQISQEFLEMYFENKRSGGGSVRSVTMLRDSACAIVSFMDTEVADNVLKKTHILQSCELLLSPYHPSILGPPQASTASTSTVGAPQNAEPTEATMNRQEPSTEISNFPAHRLIQEQDSVLSEERNVEQCGFPTEEHRTQVSQMLPEEQRMEQCEPQLEGQQNYLESTSLPLCCPLDCDTVTMAELGQPNGHLVGNPTEMEILMKPAEIRFLQEHTHDLLAGMDQVTVLPLEIGDKTGFKVTGNAVSCQTAIELLRHIVSSISSRSVTLEYPSIVCFLLGEEGQKVVRRTEQDYNCVIDTSQLSWKVLNSEHVKPWSLLKDGVPMELGSDHTPTSDEVLKPPNAFLSADIDNIKALASVLKHSGNQAEMTELSSDGDVLSNTILNIPLEDASKSTDESSDDQSVCDPEVEQLEEACKKSRDEYKERELDEEAQLLLAIQRSMDTQQMSSEEEDRELQRALAMSMLEQDLAPSEECLQRALEMSLREQYYEGNEETMQRVLEMSLMDRSTQNFGKSDVDMSGEKSTCSAQGDHRTDSARLQVFAGDETNLVVACAALRKAITGELNTVILDVIQDQNKPRSAILSALQSKHGVKMSVYGQQFHIQGFGQAPSICHQELSQILMLMKGNVSPGEMTDTELKKGVQLVLLPKTCSEYEQVVRSYHDTLQELKTIIEVLEVHKVNNVLLSHQYELKKQSMLLHQPCGQVERILYHGTTETSALEICHHGFNRSFSGKNATLYGKGVYFAARSVLSTWDKYSPPSEEGKKFVLVAEVLTGEFTLGKPDMITPPILPETTGGVPRRYDSLVDSLKEPSIFVIFNDTQANPKYLITCHKLIQGRC